MDKEPMVSMFDPAVGAYREVPLSIAEQHMAEMENLTAKVEEAKLRKEMEEELAKKLSKKK